MLEMWMKAGFMGGQVGIWAETEGVDVEDCYNSWCDAAVSCP